MVLRSSYVFTVCTTTTSPLLSLLYILPAPARFSPFPLSLSAENRLHLSLSFRFWLCPCFVFLSPRPAATSKCFHKGAYFFPQPRSQAQSFSPNKRRGAEISDTCDGRTLERDETQPRSAPPTAGEKRGGAYTVVHESACCVECSCRYCRLAPLSLSLVELPFSSPFLLFDPTIVPPLFARFSR